MKTFPTLIFCLTIGFAKAQLPSDSLITYITFENSKGYSKGYGTSVERPIATGAFTNLADRSLLKLRMAKLESSFRWPNGTAIDFTSRSSTAGKSGIVDRYVLTNPSTKEQVVLYVDPYHTDSLYYIPEGLVLVTKEMLAREIAPHLLKIETIAKTADVFVDSKQLINEEMQYLNIKVGIASFVDRENLIKVFSDTQADNDLKNFLFNTYVLNKFYALGKNFSNAKGYAYGKMKDAFLNFRQKHSDINAGNIKINLN
ncbi:hypothetical protein OQZ33_08330 [Pedobacter sp. MC2016-05]|uniref:hypothetical protein n=1 Tax=Pedobacter sp. MC2016-05 TaxID=2994474 RepID=UPI0022477F2C|nr:hypothetical protein [Pedobacter sp. MC2016-05]MCX2474331.1 hypothetical protein [Pedobacter sp. MC2016-05]